MGKAGDFVAPYRVDSGESFHLADIDPKDTGNIKSKKRAEDLLASGHRAARRPPGDALRAGSMGACS